MKHFEIYKTPDEFNDLLIQTEDGAIRSIAFIEDPNSLPKIEEANLDAALARHWLDEYFAKKRPTWLPNSIQPAGVSVFTKQVISLLKKIPYGEATTYGKLAKIVAQNRNIPYMSSQAIGGAVGRNPIVILIPCHRVLGKKNELTGYHGGLKNKEGLLKLEGIHYEK